MLWSSDLCRTERLRGCNALLTLRWPHIRYQLLIKMSPAAAWPLVQPVQHVQHCQALPSQAGSRYHGYRHPPLPTAFLAESCLVLIGRLSLILVPIRSPLSPLLIGSWVCYLRSSQIIRAKGAGLGKGLAAIVHLLTRTTLFGPSGRHVPSAAA